MKIKGSWCSIKILNRSTLEIQTFATSETIGRKKGEFNVYCTAVAILLVSIGILSSQMARGEARGAIAFRSGDFSGRTIFDRPVSLKSWQQACNPDLIDCPPRTTLENPKRQFSCHCKVTGCIEHQWLGNG